VGKNDGMIVSSNLNLIELWHMPLPQCLRKGGRTVILRKLLQLVVPS
jgi:hypothetical protein